MPDRVKKHRPKKQEGDRATARRVAADRKRSKAQREGAIARKKQRVKARAIRNAKPTPPLTVAEKTRAYKGRQTVVDRAQRADERRRRKRMSNPKYDYEREDSSARADRKRKGAAGKKKRANQLLKTMLKRRK